MCITPGIEKVSCRRLQEDGEENQFGNKGASEMDHQWALAADLKMVEKQFSELSEWLLQGYNPHFSSNKIFHFRASLVAQWLRICLPMQGTRVRALVREDPTCRGATTPCPCATTTEPACRNY
ncbi:hypothetical protein J1605_002745 [Eschrichtius robustus]|uniref:Uncharacterized protein n=1 Tax=Eschrichtius robustus TaxID=9764 RepID=A0AB34HUT6_ESCRO|nr:hypothetical protein J1605_002745 [Eschrichtius robustus]